MVALPAWLLALVCGTVLAVSLGRDRGRPTERIGSGLIAALAGVPEAVLVVLLVLLLAVQAGIVPAVSLLTPGRPPWERPVLLLLPTVSLALPAAVFCARILRGPAEEAWQRRVVTAARRRGASSLRCAVVHVLPAMAPSLIQSAAITGAGILAAGAVAESLLAYPGLGQLLATALAARDVPVVQGIALLLCALSISLLWAADLAADAVSQRGSA